MFMIADAATSYGIKMTTMQFHESLESFVRHLHIEYINYNMLCKKWSDDNRRLDGDYYHSRPTQAVSFRDYLDTKVRSKKRIYECVPSETNTKTGKLKSPPNLLQGKAGQKRLIEIAGDLGFEMDR